jgi:hypothetical protein
MRRRYVGPQHSTGVPSKHSTTVYHDRPDLGLILAHKGQNGAPSRYVTSQCHFYEQSAVKTAFFKT